MSSLPVIGQIRNFQDVQRALESIRGWLSSQSQSTNAASSVTVSQSSSPAQFPNPITDQYIASAAKWNADVTAVAPLICATGTKMVRLSYEATSLSVNVSGGLAVNPDIFDRVVSHDDDAVFDNGNTVYV